VSLWGKRVIRLFPSVRIQVREEKEEEGVFLFSSLLFPLHKVEVEINNKQTRERVSGGDGGDWQ